MNIALGILSAILILVLGMLIYSRLDDAIFGCGCGCLTIILIIAAAIASCITIIMLM